MRKTILFLALLFVAYAHVAGGPLSAPEAVDVGRLDTNELKKFEFKVKNNSNYAVRITEIKTSCSCTNVKFKGSETLAPGAERVVTGNVNFGSKIGRYETKVEITTTSKRGTTSGETVPIRGTVVAALVLDRPLLDFGDIDLSDKPKVLTVEAKRGNSGDAWDSITAVTESEKLGVTLDKESGDVVRVSVRLDAMGAPISTFRSVITLQPRQDGRPIGDVMKLPITARITGPLKATPASIYLGAITPKEPIIRSITVSSSSVDLRELTIEKHPANGRGKIRHSEERNAIIEVSLTPLADDGVFSETLTLFHKPSGIDVKIPILGVVREVRTR